MFAICSLMSSLISLLDILSFEQVRCDSEHERCVGWVLQTIKLVADWIRGGSQASSLDLRTCGRDPWWCTNRELDPRATSQVVGRSVIHSSM